MNSHLNIEVNGKPLALGDDFSIDLDFQNPMFNDTDSYSYPAEIPLDGNRHLVQNMEDKRSTLRPIDIEGDQSSTGTRARLYADGLPIFDGRLRTSDDEELTDSLSLNIEGNATLSDLVADLDCRDIPMMNPWDNRLKLGTKIHDFEMEVSANIDITPPNPQEGIAFGGITYYGQWDNIKVSDPQALGFSVNEHSNVQDAYPSQFFCNSRIAYKHYGLDDEGKTSDSVQYGEYGPYFVLDVWRPQSGVCFFVLYFLDCLFSYLGLYWDNSKLVEIEDMKRLCFFTTKCKYSVGEPIVRVSEDIPKPDLSHSKLQTWLNDHGCGTQIALDIKYSQEVDYVPFPAGTKLKGEFRLGAVYSDGGAQWFPPQDNVVVVFLANQPFDKSVRVRDGFVLSDWSMSIPVRLGAEQQVLFEDKVRRILKEKMGVVEGQPFTIPIKDEHITSVVSNVKQRVKEFRTGTMYANSDNFPEASVSTILESLENQFGIRFLYNAELKSVKAVLLRDMYRSTSKPHHFFGEVHSMNKVSERITGVRIGYSAESDAKEQRNNLRDNVKDMDTNYDYIDYPVPGSSGQSGIVKARNTDISQIYRDIYQHISNTDNTCYIDVQTGNAYRTKVDSEAEGAKDLHPAWFEVGQFKSVEFGDCSKANEDNIVEIMSSFEPLIPSDVSRAQSNRTASFLVPFADVDMEHEWVEQHLEIPFNNVLLQTNFQLLAKMWLAENYNVENTDSGNSPLQELDWGLTIGIMRGSWDAGGGFQTMDYSFDGFGNSKWRNTVLGYAVTSDTIDQFGNEWDYNGQTGGVGRGEHFSLKPRAYKTPSWAPDGIYNGTPLCAPDYEDSEGKHYFRNRGYVDRFLYEHARFLLNRRKFLIHATCTPAMIMDIKNHWQDRWRINDEIGYINKVSVQIDKNEGIGEATIEFYAI